MSIRAAASILLLLIGLLLAGLPASPALAQSRLAEFLAKIPPAELAPGADRFGSPEGTPPAAPIFKGADLLGYAYLNSDVVDATGYSGKPIHILVAIDASGKILGAKLMEHHEPIVLIGIPESKIAPIIDHFRGADVRGMAAGTSQISNPDIVSGATVTVLVIGDSIVRSALRMVQAKGLGGPAAAASAQVVVTIDTT